MTNNELLKLAVEIAKAYAESNAKPSGIPVEDVLEAAYKKLKALNED